MGNKFRSDKDAQDRKGSRVRKDKDGVYWIGDMRFSKKSIILACGLGLFFGFLGVSYILMKIFGGN